MIPANDNTLSPADAAFAFCVALYWLAAVVMGGLF